MQDQMTPSPPTPPSTGNLRLVQRPWTRRLPNGSSCGEGSSCEQPIDNKCCESDLCSLGSSPRVCTPCTSDGDCGVGGIPSKLWGCEGGMCKQLRDASGEEHACDLIFTGIHAGPGVSDEQISECSSLIAEKTPDICKRYSGKYIECTSQGLSIQCVKDDGTVIATQMAGCSMEFRPE